MNWILAKTPPGDQHNEVSAIILDDNGCAQRKVMWYDVKNKEWSEDGTGKVYSNVVAWMPIK